MGMLPKSVVVCFCFMLLSTPVLSWTVSEDTDPFTDEPELYISSGDITFRCRGASFDVVIPFGEYLSSDFVKGIYRFDKNVSVEVELVSQLRGLQYSFRTPTISPIRHCGPKNCLSRFTITKVRDTLKVSSLMDCHRKLFYERHRYAKNQFYLR